MTKYKIVNVEIANIYNDDSFKSEIISQALIWEKLEIIKTNKNWFKVRQWDCYEGWIHNSYLIDDNIYNKNNLSNKYKWYAVQNRIIKAESIDSNVIKYLSFGSVIPIIDKQNDIFVSIFPNGEKFHINKLFLLPFNMKISIQNIIDLAIENLGVPYTWGGKSGFGYDCSGFIQSLFRFANINLPRDSKEQIKYDNLKKIKNNYMGGDLIFFSENNKVSHVGMFINKVNFIHCSGEVKINSIDNNKRNYCNSLYEKFYGVYRFENNV